MSFGFGNLTVKSPVAYHGTEVVLDGELAVP